MMGKEEWTHHWVSPYLFEDLGMANERQRGKTEKKIKPQQGEPKNLKTRRSHHRLESGGAIKV